MTYRTRSPYAALPDPRRPVLIDARDVREAYEAGGALAVADLIEETLRAHVSGRAGTPAEVRLLREWVAVETEDALAYWLARLTGRRPEDSPEADRAEESAEDEPPSFATCSACGSLFGIPAGRRRGRPRSRCHECSPERSRS